MCLEVLESLPKAPPSVFLELQERSLYLSVLTGKQRSNYDNLTIDDLRRVLAHIQELVCYNLSIYERMQSANSFGVPCLNHKTASKTIDMLSFGLNAIDRLYIELDRCREQTLLDLEW